MKKGAHASSSSITFKRGASCTFFFFLDHRLEYAQQVDQSRPRRPEAEDAARQCRHSFWLAPRSHLIYRFHFSIHDGERDCQDIWLWESQTDNSPLSHDLVATNAAIADRDRVATRPTAARSCDEDPPRCFGGMFLLFSKNFNFSSVRLQIS